MKKLIISFAILLFLIGAVKCANVLAAVNDDGKGRITADASEFKYISPDTATINFTIETTDKTSQKALETNNQKMNKLVEIIKKELNSNESVKTSAYNLRQQYEYNNVTKKNVMTGYIVTNSVIVTLKDTKKAGHLISVATQNGATKVNGLSFTIQSTDAVCKELTQKAVLKAKKQAEDILAPLGKTIDSIENISYGCSTQGEYRAYSNYLMKSYAAGAADAAISDTPVEQGETKVTANVTIVFRIK